MSDEFIILLKIVGCVVGGIALIGAGPFLLGLRFIPNNRVGIV
jgi:hypothetical protein